MATIELWYAKNLSDYILAATDADKRAIERDHVLTIEEEFSDEILEQCWAWFNRGSGQERPELDQQQMRSMSCGDVIRVITDNGTVMDWYCDIVGFTLIERGLR